MTLSEIRKRFLEFYKARGHVIIPSASLVPENDSTTLFTGSGMQPLVPYLLGENHPEGKRLVNSQKSFRAEDIDEVGDNQHTTFFEMLGNWSLGAYWKQDQLSWFFEFLTKEVGLKPENLYATIFSGGEGINRDDESVGIWQKLFIDAKLTADYVEMDTEEKAGEKGMKPGQRIFGYGVKKNWWSRAGVPSEMPVGEPGGPDSEVFYDFDPTGKMHTEKSGKFCHPNCECGRFMEIGNSVFMEYKKSENGAFEKLKQRNVDFGGGLERIAAASNDNADIFEINIFENAKRVLEDETGKSYIRNKKAFRIILDHMRAATFLIADGVLPSNVGRGYLVRRLLRRAVLFGDSLGTIQGKTSNQSTLFSVSKAFIEQYMAVYPQGHGLAGQEKLVLDEIEKEEKKFRVTLREGLKEFNKHVAGGITGKDAFDLYQSYGFPWQMTKELAESAGTLLVGAEVGFEAEFEKHRELSRTSSAGRFKGGLADNSEKTTQLHTAHHLLLKALQTVLGSQVKQRGSNITSERLRMDFSYDSKMTDEQKEKVEKIVNEKIVEDLPVIHSEMPKEKAEMLGAEHEFGQKYPSACFCVLYWSKVCDHRKSSIR